MRYAPLVLLAATAAIAIGLSRTSIGKSTVASSSGGQQRLPTEAELRQRLTSEQYRVTQEAATEPPFHNAFWDHHQPGIYVDIVSGEPLFSSLDKFDSGTGWPSFTRSIRPMVDTTDSSLGMTRTEVRSKVARSHLGHLFDDGPAPTMNRYCINSAALRFVPVAEMESQGYAAYRAPFVKAGIVTATPGPHRERAILAGGCFWGMEEIIRKLPGVIETRVGYAGGTKDAPTYSDVSSGTTGHAEAIEVSFDADVMSYEKLIDNFFRMHDPTTPDRQHNDVGTQYRSAIFFTSEAQRATAARIKNEFDTSGRFSRPIVTEIAAATTFFSAESYHQKYLVKHPEGYTCHVLVD